MIDFNFLRIRWPKLAAIAADASRLVEVSPTSAISTMQNFCEWAADIALDFYDIDTPNGTAQPQKLEMLKSTGRVPPEILSKFQNIMSGGTGTTSSYRSYRMHDDVVEARRLIEDMQEVARWLHREADRAGWTSPSSPSASRGRATRSTLGPTVGAASSPSGGLLAYLEPYMPILLIAGGVILVVGLGIGLAFALSNKGSKDALNNTALTFSSTPLVDATDSPLVSEPTASPTPAAEQSTYLDEVEPETKPTAGYYSKQWTFNGKDYNLAIDTFDYQHGIGLFVPYKSITSSSNSVSVKYKLDGKYSALKFDLGADANLGYKKENGKYQIRIYADDNTTPIYDSKSLAYDATDMGVTVDVTGVTELKIKLTETKSTGKSTLNIVLGNAKLILAGTGDNSTGGNSTGDNSSAEPGVDASASPDAGSSASAADEASASPTDTGDTAQ